MLGSLKNYLSEVLKATEASNGRALSTQLSLSDGHVRNQDLYLPQPEGLVKQFLKPPMDEAVSAHLKVLFHLTRKPPNYLEAYQHQTSACGAAMRLLQQLKDETWCLPLVFRVCLDLRHLAQACEKHCRGLNQGQVLEKAADSLMACFRVCVADKRSSKKTKDSKRLGMMTLVNQLFKIYFRANKQHLCKPLQLAVDSCAVKVSFPLKEQVTYKYFVGRRSMFDSKYRAAGEDLEFAFRHCPARFKGNKRLILSYLAPVKMLLGYLPSEELLQRYNLLMFHDLALALKAGNVGRFDEIVNGQELVLIRSGIYLLVGKLKFLVYRNLFKKVFVIRQSHQLDMGDFLAALKFVGVKNVTMAETHCIVANLIYEGKIKGYISHDHNKLVVSKQSPFPALTSMI